MKAASLIWPLLICCTVMFARPSASASKTDTDSDSLFLKGLTELENGNYDNAAAIWVKAKDEESTPDFRIGQSLIEMVTDQEMKEYYEKAVDTYYWGLKAELVPQEVREALLREIRLLEPIVGYRTQREWTGMVEEGDPEIYSRLTRFWKTVDLTPGTSYNERLIEHWERVAYANEHYRVNGTVGLDDRADTYLRFGPPDVHRSGQLLYDSGTVNSLLSERMNMTTGNMSRDPFQNQVRSAQRFNMENNIRSLHEYPQYEVWIYKRLNEDPDNTIFLFGTGSGSNKFQRKNAVEDFIPNSAFSLTDRNQFMNILTTERNQSQGRENEEQQLTIDDMRTGSNEVPPMEVTPALIMQIMYYQQLAALDEYFGSAYNWMMNRYVDPTVRLSRSLAREFENRNGNDLLELQAMAPDENSRYKASLADVPIEVYPYRYLDEQNETYIRLFVRSAPADAVYYDHIKSVGTVGDRLWTRYELSSGVHAVGPSGEDLIGERVNLSLNPAARSGVFARFELDYPAQVESLLISSEVHHRYADSTLAADTPFRSSLRGLGKRELDLPDRLDSRNLEMGDIIIGHSSESGSVSDSDHDMFPFTIAHDRVIPEGSLFHLYYEVYNLEQDEEGRSRFSFTYSIESRRTGLRIFGGGGDELRITLNNEALEDRFSQVLDIKTSELDEGRYQLVVEIEDLLAERTLERTINFDVQ